MLLFLIKVGNGALTEVILSFKSWVGKVQAGQIRDGFSVIYSLYIII